MSATTIEKMAEAHFRFLESDYDWHEIGPAGQAVHLAAMERAIMVLPNAIYVEGEHGRYAQGLAEARDSILEEKAAADARCLTKEPAPSCP